MLYKGKGCLLSFPVPVTRLSGINEQSHTLFYIEVVMGRTNYMGQKCLCFSIKHENQRAATHILAKGLSNGIIVMLPANNIPFLADGYISIK